MSQQTIVKAYGNYINGEWVGKDLPTRDVVNPVTNEVIGYVPNGGTKETKEAIEAAHFAFLSWSQTTAYERGKLLRQLHELVLENKEELAKTMTLEMGKPIRESRGEVDSVASFLDWYAEEGKRIYGETIPSHNTNKRLQVWKKPVGVVGAITPWNFPAGMLARKMGPALAAGCTIVIKPSSESPLTAIKIVELCEQAGFPKGVVNLVTGSSQEIGDELMANPKVRKITFTGSTEVGKQLIEQSAAQVKRLSLELGGHAPVIILDDANIDLAVRESVASAFRNTGQTCVCANRIYVQEGIHDQFVEKYVEAVQALKVENSLEETAEIGPLINKSSLNKVIEHVEDAVQKGAKVACGGERLQELGENFYKPTVLCNVDSSMIVMHEETFGPLAPIQKISSIEEAAALANDTPYGLAAYVFTNNVSKGMKLIEKLEYGIIGWNDGVPSTTQAPFGGMKESGVGREGGHEGIEPYIESQFVSINLE